MDKAQIEKHFDSLLKGFPDGDRYYYPNMGHCYKLRDYILCSDDNWTLVTKILDLHRPNPTPCGNLIQFYESKVKAGKDVITTIKPAKYIGKIMPWASDSYKESFLLWFKDSFKPVEFTIFESREESAFIGAYAGKVYGDKSPVYSDKHGFTIKSLTGSCMRKSFIGLDKHPASVYASGDFSIVYAKENKTGDILARCVVGNNSAECIYTNDDLVTHAIESYLFERGIANESNWAGLSLKKEYIGNNEYLMPYIDGYDSLDDEGNTFVIARGRGSIGLGNTNGKVSYDGQDEENMGYCESCEDSYDYDDLTTVTNTNGNEVCICCSCRNADYSWSNIQQEYIPDESCVTFYESDNRWGNVTKEYAMDNGAYVESEDEYYAFDMTIEYEGEYYLKTDSANVELVNGDYLHKQSDEYKEYKAAYETVTESKWEYIETIVPESSRGVMTPSLVYNTTSVEVLRDNYQIDSCGN